MKQTDTEAGARSKIWHARMLTYITAGIVILFFGLFWGDLVWSLRDRVLYPVASLMLYSFDILISTAGLFLVSFTNFTNTFLNPTISYISAVSYFLQNLSIMTFFPLTSSLHTTFISKIALCTVLFRDGARQCSLQYNFASGDRENSGSERQAISLRIYHRSNLCPSRRRLSADCLSLLHQTRRGQKSCSAVY